MQTDQQTKKTTVRVRHVFEHDGRQFERDVNEALRRIISEGGVVYDVKYASDPAAARAGGYGALIVFEASPEVEI